MINTIDIVVLILFTYYLWRGWRKGFLGAVLGPVSLAAGCILSYNYYLKTQNIVISLLISLLGPFLLHLTLAILLKIWTLSPDKKKKPSLVSRLFGAAFSLSWSGGIIVLLILLIMVIPSAVPYAGQIRDHLSETKTYTLISYYSKQNPLQPDDNIRMEKLSQTEEFKQVMKDDKFRKLVTDPEVQKYIGDKDFNGLMNNDKVKDAMKDRDLMIQLFEFQKRIIQDSLESEDTKIPQTR